MKCPVLSNCMNMSPTSSLCLTVKMYEYRMLVQIANTPKVLSTIFFALVPAVSLKRDFCRKYHIVIVYFNCVNKCHFRSSDAVGL